MGIKERERERWKKREKEFFEIDSRNAIFLGVQQLETHQKIHA